MRTDPTPYAPSRTLIVTRVLNPTGHENGKDGARTREYELRTLALKYSELPYYTGATKKASAIWSESACVRSRTRTG